MVFAIVKNWEIIIDGIQILLCLLILFYLFRNRSKRKDQNLIDTETKYGQDFNAQVFSQTIKQEVDRSFARVIETIAVEQDRLQNALRYKHQGNDAWDISEFHLRSNLSDRNENFQNPEFTDGRQKHDRIRSLAAGGMNTRQISEELKAPLGEVELVLSLNSENN